MAGTAVPGGGAARTVAGLMERYAAMVNGEVFAPLPWNLCGCS